MLRINTGNAAAIVAYRQVEHSAAAAQRNDNMMSTAMPYRIVGGFLCNPIKVKRNVVILDGNIIPEDEFTADLIGVRNPVCERLQRFIKPWVSNSNGSRPWAISLHRPTAPCACLAMDAAIFAASVLPEVDMSCSRASAW